eukprot:jgi/Bigna1/144602/aug1.89_g19310
MVVSRLALALHLLSLWVWGRAQTIDVFSRARGSILSTSTVAFRRSITQHSFAKLSAFPRTNIVTAQSQQSEVGNYAEITADGTEAIEVWVGYHPLIGGPDWLRVHRAVWLRNVETGDCTLVKRDI